MDGRERLQAQVLSGTRQRVTFVDACRLRYGMTRVVCLTPRVETRLRSGAEAAIPLQVRYVADGGAAALLLTLPRGYPLVAVGVEVECTMLGTAAISASSGDAEAEAPQLAALREKLAALCSELQQASDAAAQAAAAEEEEEEAGNTGAGAGAADVVGLGLGDLFEALLRSCGIDSAGVGAGGVLQAHNWAAGAAEAAGDYASDCSEGAEEGEEGSKGEEEQVQVPCWYRCGRCRNLLFASTDLTTHAQATTGLPCASLFLEAAPDSDSMGIRSNGVTGSCMPDSQKGLLTCGKCSHKLGSWTWVGHQCSCRAWVCPAFQVPLSRVDPDYRDPRA